eukprot:CAMPEP_0116860172 /NCGR_PEP_ID=MMETSP0418-20121206/22255_1 /TAXON_ID=1158023 /ORGANISM="Astrosyne radiata, Strain 13vi08-1A" /LENGTH=291 /DNA_ID=CAMNT_0004494525 /DNA_START=15 /DNA_END=890 /DNA_ORIENTATION=-
METIRVMRLQENQVYHAGDYLSSAAKRMPQNEQDETTMVDKEYRKAMTMWCYQVVDCLKCHREMVEIAMSYLDRFLMTSQGMEGVLRKNRSKFQLAVMTCLYMAIKLQETRHVLTLEAMVQLSENRYSEEEIVEMERTILGALEWRMNPPTSLCFLHQFMAILSKDDDMSQSERQRVLEKSRFQTEVAVNEYKFVGVNASTIAFASLINTLLQEQRGSLMMERMKVVAEAAQIRVESNFMKNVMEILRMEVSSTTLKKVKRSSSLRRKSVQKRQRSQTSSSPKSVAVTKLE